MLTATYALVALTVEQARVRRSLLAFQQYARANFTRQPWISLGQLQYACDTLSRLHQAAYWRKMESYLFPALRQATRQADQLLEELTHLHQCAHDLIGNLQACHGKLAGNAGMALPALQCCDGIDAYCDVMFQRLDKEEAELFAMARRVLGGDAWFAIAHQFMDQDAQWQERRLSKPALRSPARSEPVTATMAPARHELPPRLLAPVRAAAPRRLSEQRGALIE